MTPLLIETLQRITLQCGSGFCGAINKAAQPRRLIGHIAGCRELRLRQGNGLVLLGSHQIGQRQVLKRSSCYRFGIGRIVCIAGIELIHLQKERIERVSQAIKQELANSKDAFYIRHFRLLNQKADRRQTKQLSNHRLVQVRVCESGIEHARIGLDQAFWQGQSVPCH